MKICRPLAVLFVLALVLAACSPRAEKSMAKAEPAPATEPLAEPAAPAAESPKPAVKITKPLPQKKSVAPVSKEKQAGEAVKSEAVKSEQAPAPAVPASAPQLVIQAPATFSADPVTVTVPAAPEVHLKYTTDGSDPAQGKAWPEGGLVVSRSMLLKVWGAQTGGASATAEQAFTIGELWLSPTGQGDGSWQNPMASLDQAMVLAAQKHFKRLVFEPGTWKVGTTLQGTWEWTGGWVSPGVRAQDETVLVGLRKSGTTLLQPGFAVEAGERSSVTLSNLTIRSANSSYGAAVLASTGAKLEIKNCKLYGGAGLYGYGLRAVASSSVSVTDSTLYGGDGGSTIALSADKTALKVTRCSFDAGTGNAISYGLNLTLTSLSMVSSVVWGGVADSSYGIGLYSSPESKILGCTIVGGSGLATWAVYLSESHPTIVDCLIGTLGKGKKYGVWVNFGKSLPSALRNNVFFGSASGIFAGSDWKAQQTEPTKNGGFLDLDGNPLAGVSGNRVVKAGWGSSPDFHTEFSAGRAVVGTGEALTGDAALDRAGRTRGSHPAIGAWATSPSN